jgi:hypothetical protein
MLTWYKLANEAAMKVRRSSLPEKASRHILAVVRALRDEAAVSGEPCLCVPRCAALTLARNLSPHAAP